MARGCPLGALSIGFAGHTGALNTNSFGIVGAIWSLIASTGITIGAAAGIRFTNKPQTQTFANSRIVYAIIGIVFCEATKETGERRAGANIFLNTLTR